MHKEILKTRVLLYYARERGACPKSLFSEKFVEAKLKAETSSRGGFCWKLSSPGTAGVPDRLVLLDGGRIGFVEVKATGRRPRALQMRRMNELSKSGFFVAVVDHPELVGEVLDAIQAA